MSAAVSSHPGTLGKNCSNTVSKHESQTRWISQLQKSSVTVSATQSQWQQPGQIGTVYILSALLQKAYRLSLFYKAFQRLCNSELRNVIWAILSSWF